MVAALSPADINYDETLSTLRYSSLVSTAERTQGHHKSFCRLWIFLGYMGSHLCKEESVLLIIQKA